MEFACVYDDFNLGLFSSSLNLTIMWFETIRNAMHWIFNRWAYLFRNIYRGIILIGRSITLIVYKMLTDCLSETGNRHIQNGPFRMVPSIWINSRPRMVPFLRDFPNYTPSWMRQLLWKIRGKLYILYFIYV